MCNLHFLNLRDFDNFKAVGVRVGTERQCVPSQIFVLSFQILLVSSWFCDFDSRVDALYSEGKTIENHKESQPVHHISGIGNV